MSTEADRKKQVIIDICFMLLFLTIFLWKDFA